MTALEKRLYSEAEYLELERESDTRHEYFQGELYAMAGGSETHDLIAGNVWTRLTMQLLDRPCRIHGSDTLTLEGVYWKVDLEG